MIFYRRKFLFYLILLSMIVSVWDMSFIMAANSIAKGSPSNTESTKAAEKTIQLLGPQIEKLTREDLIRLARAYSDLGNFQSSIKVLTAALSLNSKDVEVKTFIGQEQFKLNKDKEALLTFKEALEINKKFVPAYKGLIKLYEKRKNRYELRLLYQDLITNVGEKPDYISKLCELSTLDGLYELTDKYCNKGISLLPNEPANYIFLYQSYKYRGDIEKAVIKFDELIKKFPNHAQVNISYAQIKEEKKDYISAYSLYLTASKSEPKSLTAQLGVGAMGVEIQKFQQAFEAFEKACNIDRTALPAVRKATNIIRVMKNQEWAKKFDQLSDRCGQKL